MRKIRIGIDVGGTFTDAVAIDNETGEIIAREKLPTTHASGEGVAEGIITVLQNLLNRNRIAPAEVVFIAHGTTQATNALLEGDVAVAGILAMGSGLEAARAKRISNTGNIPLARGKELKTLHVFVKTADAAAARQEISSAIEKLKEAGAEVIVATEPYSVDNPDNEQFVMELAREKGLYATGRRRRNERGRSAAPPDSDHAVGAGRRRCRRIDVRAAFGRHFSGIRRNLDGYLCSKGRPRHGAVRRSGRP